MRGNKWLSLVILVIGFLMILIDTTIVNVSIPTLIKDLHANLTDVEWIISGYSLSFAALLITFGRLGDMYGRKLVFLLGLAVFSISSFFSGQAGGPDALIVSRLFQGLGAAMISPTSLSIISATFQGRERATAFGIWGATAGIAAALGPILGGYFTTYSTWRWIFYVNIPIGLVGILLGAWILKESKINAKERLDLSGMLTSALGFFFLVFSLIEGQNYGWLKPHNAFAVGSHVWHDTHASVIPLCIGLGVLFLDWFAVIEAGKSAKLLEPAVNTGLFSSRAYTFGLIATAVIALGEFSSLFTLPIYLQSVRGYTPLHSGYATLPIAIGTFVAAPISGRIANRVGTKWVITTGIICETAGLFLFSLIKIATPYSHIWPALALLGVGIGLAIAQTTQATLSQIPPKESGSASGVLNTVRQVGTALGIAVIGAILAHQVTSNIAGPINAINGLPNQAKQQIISSAGDQSVASAGASNSYSLPQPIAGEIKQAVDGALTTSIGQAVRFGSIFLAIGAALSLLIPNIKQERREESPSAS